MCDFNYYMHHEKTLLDWYGEKGVDVQIKGVTWYCILYLKVENCHVSCTRIVSLVSHQEIITKRKRKKVELRNPKSDFCFFAIYVTFVFTY